MYFIKIKLKINALGNRISLKILIIEIFNNYLIRLINIKKL